VKLCRQLLRSEFAESGFSDFGLARGRHAMRATLRQLPADFKTDAAIRHPPLLDSCSYLFLAEVFARRLCDLCGVGAMLKAGNDAGMQRPDMREPRFERPARRLGSRGVCTECYDWVVCSKNSDGSVCQFSKSV
jgi:hypothetical protein